MTVQLADIFHGVTPAAVRNYVAVAVRDLDPPLVIHPCVGRFGALTACVLAGSSPERHLASDLNLFTSVIGSLAAGDPIADLGLTPGEEVERFFDGADPNDDLDYAARVMLGMKYVQIRPTNRYLDGMRRDLRVRMDEHIDSLKHRLHEAVEPIGGCGYQVRNLWDVVEGLEAEPPPKGTVLYMSMTWYEGDFSKQLAAAEAAFGWPGLVGREFNPETLPELLSRVNAIPGVRVFAHCGHAVADLVPPAYEPVVAYVSTKDGRIDRLYASEAKDLSRYAPSPIRELDPKSVKLWTDSHELTENSKLELVPLDTDTAQYVRDLYVHRLGRSAAELYFGMLLDGRLVTVFGLMVGEVLGHGHQTTWIKEQFGVTATSSRYPRFNRLAPLALTSGETLMAIRNEWPALQVRKIEGIQSTDIRAYNDSKVKRGPFRGYYKEQQPDGMWKIVTRGVFRDDTWDECYKQWWKKWNPEAVRQRQEEERERKRKQNAIV